MSKTDMYQAFTFDEFTYYFTPRKNILYTYVVEDVAHKITDIVSFYNLPSNVLWKSKHDVIRTAYSYYNICTTSWVNLVHDALILAKQNNFDIYTILDATPALEKFEKCLKFAKGN